jgi:xylulose-5-phosphate/fructose-6-phosphate phosphoketolase
VQGQGTHLKEWLKRQIIESINYAYAEGVDKPDITGWTWPLAKMGGSR